MMVTISIRELLPTAHFYDPEDGVVTRACIGGMFVMALSLVLFLIGEQSATAKYAADKLIRYAVFYDRCALVTACSIMWC
jgi:hypothetical protein